MKRKTPWILQRGRRLVAMIVDPQTVNGPIEALAVRASEENQVTSEGYSKTEDTASAHPDSETSLNKEISGQVPKTGLSMVIPNFFVSSSGVQSPVVPVSMRAINGGEPLLEKAPLKPKPSSNPETSPMTNEISPDCDEIPNNDQTEKNAVNVIDEKNAAMLGIQYDCDSDKLLNDCQRNADISPHLPETSRLNMVSNLERTPTDLNEFPQMSDDPAHILFSNCDDIPDDFESSLNIPVIDCTNDGSSLSHIMIPCCDDELPSNYYEPDLSVPLVDCTSNQQNNVSAIPHSRESNPTSIMNLNYNDVAHNGSYEVVEGDGIVSSEAALSEFLIFDGNDKIDDSLEPYPGPSGLNDLANDKKGLHANDPDYNPNSSDYSSDEFDAITCTDNNSLALAPCDAQDGDVTGCSRKRRGRKRKHEEQHHGNVKLLKNSNKTYFNHKGKEIVAKEWNDVQCACNAKCHNLLDANLRQDIFKEFWGLGDYKAQNLFIAACVTENQRCGAVAKKAFTRIYTLQKVKICREMFRKSLQISTKRIDTALKKFRLGDVKDRRGLKQGGQNKINDEQREQVKSHINKLPRYKSHYRRSDTDAEFLAVDMTLPKMYDLYLIEKFGESSDLLEAWKEAKDRTEKNAMATQVGGVVSFTSYRRIFLTDFNLKFKSLKKDTCNQCDSLAARLTSATTDEEKKALEKEQRIHQELWQGARALMKQDQEMAASKTENVETLTFDLEKTLPLPRIPTSIVFYKRQLWLYNAGVHSCRNNQGYCYVWTEDMAGRGAQEIGSCLIKHIGSQVGPEIRHLILWSDSCGGQNRNIKMVLMLKCCLESHPTLETINLKFLVSGHSFLPNDTDFSDIECALTHVQRLYLPEDYMNVMKTARKKKPFIVTKMGRQDFKGTQKLEGMITNRKQGASQEKINWLKIREIKITKNEPFVIYCRPDFQSDYSIINVQKKAVRGRKQSSETNFFQGNLVPMWEKGKEIAAPKLRDLKSLMHLLTNEAKRFYNSLQGSRSVDDDIDGFGAPLDFEIEEE